MARRILPIRKPGRPAHGSAAAPETREHLLHVARDIVGEKGLAELSLREIAARAQVNPALLNYYFGGIDALQTEMIDSALDRFDEALVAQPEGPAELIAQLSAVLWERPELARLFASPFFAGKNASARAKKTRARLREVVAAVFSCSEDDTNAVLAFVLSLLSAPHLFTSGARITKEERETFQLFASKAVKGLKRSG